MTYFGTSYILSKHDNLKSNQTTGLEFKQKEALRKLLKVLAGNPTPCEGGLSLCLFFIPCMQTWAQGFTLLA